MPGTRPIPAPLESAQIAPARLHAHRPSRALGDPGRHLLRRPPPAVGRRPLQRPIQLRLLLLTQHARSARIAVSPIPDPPLAARVVAPRHGVDPRQRVARRLPHLLAGSPTRQQPHNLPLAARHGVLRLPVASLQFLRAQIRSYAYPLSHIASLSRKTVSVTRPCRPQYRQSTSIHCSTRPLSGTSCFRCEAVAPSSTAPTPASCGVACCGTPETRPTPPPTPPGRRSRCSVAMGCHPSRGLAQLFPWAVLPLGLLTFARRVPFPGAGRLPDPGQRTTMPTVAPHSITARKCRRYALS